MNSEKYILGFVFFSVALAAWGLLQPMFLTMHELRRINSPDIKQTRLSGWIAAIVTGSLAAAAAIAFGRINVFVLILAICIASYIAYQLPFFLYRKKMAKRQKEFRQQLVDLTINLATGLRAGGALGQSLHHIARESKGVMAEELNQILRENKLGVELAECFVRLSRRMVSEDMTLLATAIRLTQKTGGSLAEVLDKMTVMMRDRKEFDERLQTMTAQGKFEAFIMGLAPLAAFGILFLIDRSMVEPLYKTNIGLFVMFLVLFLEGIGFYFINKIVAVEV